MAGRFDSDEAGWGLVAGAVGVVIAVGAANVVAGDLTRHGLVGIVALVALVAGAVYVVGHGGLTRAFRWTRGAPKPLGGEARWGRLWDLWRAGWLGEAGWPIGGYNIFARILYLFVAIPDTAQPQNTLLLGPVGAGKTDGVLVPIVRAEGRVKGRGTRDADRHSLLLLDPKGDVADKTWDALARSHERLIWNPAHPERSTIAIDPLRWIPADPSDPTYVEACDNAAKAWLAATYSSDETGATAGYLSDPYWQKQVSSVFKGLLLYLKAIDPGLTLPDVARYLADVTPDEMVRHLTTHPRTAAAELRGASFRELLLNERARGAVVGDLIERCALLTDPRLPRVLTPGALPAFDLDAFLAHPTVLALQVGALGDSTLPLLSVVLATIQTELVRRTQGGGRLPRGIRIVVDEAGVIGRIHGLDTGVAMLRSANVGYLLALQATDQLRATYGRERAETILSSLTHRIVLGGTTGHDAEWICGTLGRRNAYRDLTGTDGRGAALTHFVREEWPLLRPDELRRLRFEFVVDSSHVPPLRLRMPFK